MTDPKPYTTKQVIAALDRLADHWPKDLGLFSWSGRLCLIQKDKDGNWPGDGYSEATIEYWYAISNDGGDPD